jgi:hypothetical protein
MPGAARHQDVGPWARRDLLLADTEGELALEHVEGLLHFAVDVRHRPQALAAGELREGKGAAGGGLSGRQHPHLNNTKIDGPPFAGSDRVRVP